MKKKSPEESSYTVFDIIVRPLICAQRLFPLAIIICLFSAGCKNKGTSYILAPGGSQINGYNLNLSSMDISEGILVFNPDVVAYSVEVAYDVDSITVTPVLSDTAASIEVNGLPADSGLPFGPVDIVPGLNMVVVMVTAPDGYTSKSYMIAVSRNTVLSNNANLAGLSVSSGALSTTFHPNTVAYNCEVDWDVSEITVTPTASSLVATLKVNGAEAESGSPSDTILLSTGTNTITVEVTAEDGITIKTYTVVVTRIAEPSHNANLSDIVLAAGTLTPEFDPDFLPYEAEVAYQIESITVTPFAAGVNAAITINGESVDSGTASDQLTLDVGETPVVIVVTAEDGTTVKTYTVEVTRVAASTNAALASLSLSAGTMSPTFDPEDTDYDAEVPYQTESVTVTPEASGINAVITVNGETVASGMPSSPVDLSVGQTDIAIEVTAEDGTTTRTYTVEVSRVAASSNAYLAGLTISAGTLSPDFDQDDDEYTAAVPYENDAMTVTPTAAGLNAVITVEGSTVISGAASQSIPLAEGANEIDIEVTAEDGIASRSYRVTVTRGNDATPPAPGNGGTLTVTDRGDSYLVLRWDAADDGPTAPGDLLYTVYRSASGNIGTWEECESAGITVNGPAGAITHLAVTGLDPLTEYYFNVVVEDPAGLKACYTMTSAETTGRHLPVTNGSVNAMVKDGTTLYIGGIFTEVGEPAPYHAVFDASSGGQAGAVIPVNINGVVNAVAPDGEGGWFIGGDFTSVNGTSRNRLARINGDGTLHDFEADVNNNILTMAVSGGTVFIGGTFTAVAGQGRIGIAAIDGDSGELLPWNFQLYSSINRVYCLAIDGDTIYVGGTFSYRDGGEYRYNLASVDINTGTANSWGTGCAGTVNSLCVDENAVYVGGSFTSIGGVSRSRIAAIDKATGEVTPWDPVAGGSVYALVVSGSTVYAGGSFTTIGGVTRNYIAAIDKTSAMPTTWNPNADGNVGCLAINGGTLYAGGSFTSMGGVTRKRIAAVDVSTGIATAWDPSLNSPVYAVAVINGSVVAGGGFTLMGSLTRNNLAAVELLSSAIMNWDPNMNNEVYCLAVSSSLVYAGGKFTIVGGYVRYHFASVEKTTAAVFGPQGTNSSGYVRAMTMSGGVLYVGGDFYNIRGVSRNRIAALDPDSGAVLSWNPNIYSNSTGVHAIAVDGSTLYAGGAFTSVGAVERIRIAAIDVTTGAPTAWDPRANNTVTTLFTDGSIIYTGGLFTVIDEQFIDWIAGLDISTGEATDWRPDADNTVAGMIISGSTVYACGSFTAIGGESRPYIASLDAISGNATAWNPSVDAPVNAMLIDGDTVYAGGNFTDAGGKYRKGLVGLDINTGEAQ